MNFKNVFRLGIASLLLVQSPLFAAETIRTKIANNQVPAPTISPAPLVKPLPAPAPAVVSPSPIKVKKTASKKGSKLDRMARKVNYNFKCIDGTTTALVARTLKKELSPVPIIQWTQQGSKEFGDKYSPIVRCNEVTARFNQHFLKVASTQKGSNLKLPALRVGIMNKMTVVCASDITCGDSNLLWTLKKENSKNATAVVAQLKELIKNKGKASVGPILESEEQDVSLESTDPNAVEMEEAIPAMISAKLESEEPELLAELESEDAEVAALESEDTALESEDTKAPEQLESENVEEEGTK